MPTANEIEMLQAALAAGITSRDELANLMAQVGSESSGLTRLEESFRYTRGVARIPVRSVLREGFDAAEAARLAALDGRPEELARLMYGARLGNDDAGDGYLYRGRGYIQLTGEDNYRAAGAGLNLDLVGHPELAADRQNAIRIALWYWNRVPQLDRDDVTAATYSINGGYNGLQDRFDRFDAWHAELTPEFMADLEAGRLRPGNGVSPAVGREAMADDALRRFEAGPEVRQLQTDLHALGIRDDRRREMGINGNFGDRTEQGVRHFQEAHGLPVTGRAGPETLDAVRDALQQHRQPLPENLNPPHMRPPGNLPRRDEEQELQNHRPFRDDHVYSFPTHHRDYALFEAIRRQLPPGTSNEMAAHVVLEAKRGGVKHLSKLDEVIVEDGTVFVIGKTPGDMAIVELSAHAPALQATLQESMEFDEGEAVKLAKFKEEHREINARGGGPEMRPPGGGFDMG